MEDEKYENTEEINDEAPPLPFLFQLFNDDNENDIQTKNNINDINLNDNNESNIKELKENKSIDNDINFNYNSFNLLKNQHCPNFDVINLNTYNKIQSNNINNINNVFIPYNNINNSINKKKYENNSNLDDLKIDIKSDTLNKLNKNYLIDIILFINDLCKIKIDPKNLLLKHKIFKIKKDKSKNNGHLFVIKKNILASLSNSIDNINNISDSDDGEIDQKENIKSEEKNINNINNINLPNDKININNCNSFYCKVHNKIYKNVDYNTHCKEHQKCKICGAEFKRGRLLKTHMKTQHSEIFYKNQNSNENENKNKEKVQCSDCDLLFNSVELMSSHYYETHEKNKLKNIINIEENPFSIYENKEINQSKEEHESLFEKKIELFDIMKQEKEQIINLEEKKRKHEELKRIEELKIKEELKREEELRIKEKLKRQEELRIKEELKRQEELKRLEELKKKIEENKRQEYIERIREEKILQLLKEQEQNDSLQNIKKNEYYYECYHDSITFETEQKYINHFRKFHPNDFPFYCDICNKGFYSYKAINEHNRAKGHII